MRSATKDMQGVFLVSPDFLDEEIAMAVFRRAAQDNGAPDALEELGVARASTGNHAAASVSTVTVDANRRTAAARRLRACLRTQAVAGWAAVEWRARRRVMTMIMAQ